MPAKNLIYLLFYLRKNSNNNHISNCDEMATVKRAIDKQWSTKH